MMRYAAIACFAALAAAAPAELPLYSTSFETSEGYTAGASIDNVNGWRVINGAVTVESGAGAMSSGAFVQLGTGGILDRGFTNTEGANVVWVEGYFKGAGSSVRLADATYPLSDLDGASAIVHFSSEGGIELLDGDGAGGTRAIVSADVPLGEANAGNWYKVTLKIDFAAHTWDIWVNDVKRNTTALGFRDNSVTQLNGFRNLAQTGAGFDLFRVAVPVSGDANGDTKVDGADIVRVIEYATGAPSDPIILADSDLNNDGDINTGDVTVLQSRLIDSGM